MRRRWWRFGWHPGLRDGLGTVTLHYPGGASETWAYLACGCWFMVAREAPQPPVYATREDALRDVMRSGRAAVFEADDRGAYRRTWQEPAPSAAPARETKEDDRG
jgi:hypothetical protein